MTHEAILAKWGARGGKSSLGKTLFQFFFAFRRVLISPLKSRLAYAIRSELRCIVPRIRFRSGPEMSAGVFLGPAVEQAATGRLAPNRRTQARIQSMRALSSNQPWVEGVEQWFYLQGWEAGAKWAENNSHIEGME